MSAHLHLANAAHYSYAWNNNVLFHLRNRDDGWAVPHKNRIHPGRAFALYRKYNKRPLNRALFAELYREKKMLDISYESQAFDLADYDRKGYLDLEGYILACHLLSRFSKKAMPRSLPRELIPPSKRHYHLGGAQDLTELAENRRFNPFIACPASFQPYGRLSNELWGVIIDFLPTSALKEVCCASRRFYSLAFSVLYRDVHLNQTDDKIFHDPHDYDTILIDGETSRQKIHLYIQQYRFLRSILRKPGYSPFVRSFSWSMNTKPQELHLPYWIDDEPAFIQESLETTLFPHLRNVTSLDLNVSTITDPLLIPTSSSSLFPNTTSLTLRGLTSDCLARKILTGADKAPLKSLSLSTLYRLVLTPLNSPDYLPSSPGNTLSLLSDPTFLSRCTNLQHLTLSKVSLDNDIDRTPVHFHTLLNRERETYKAWAGFMREVKPRRVLLKRERVSSGTWEPNDFTAFSMNSLFGELVRPVVMKGWAGLESLELRGIYVGDEEVLRSSLKGVEVVVNQEVEISDISR